MTQVHPLQDWVLVERITETVSAGGIHLPATFSGSRSSKLNARPDYWRARVVALGPLARDLEPGDEVLVHTWAAEDGKGLYAGVHAGGGQVLVRWSKDILCAVERDAAEPGPESALELGVA